MLNEFKGMDPSISGTCEENFMRKSIEAAKNGRLDDYEKALSDFRKISEIDSWRNVIFMKIHDKIKENPIEVMDDNLERFREQNSEDFLN